MPATRSWRAALVAVCLLLLAGTIVVGPAAAADPGRLTGTVLNDSGVRLAGASVRLLDDWGETVAQTNADGNGTYTLAAPQSTYRLVVTHAHQGGWLKATVQNVTVASASALDVVAVAPFVHLRGRVSVPGFPSATASVSLTGLDSGPEIQGRRLSEYGAHWADGRYDLIAKPGVYDLEVNVNINSVPGAFTFHAGAIDLAGDRTLDLDIPIQWVTIGTSDTSGPLRPGTQIQIGTDPDVPPITIAPSLPARPTFRSWGTTDASGFVRLPSLSTPKLLAFYRAGGDGDFKDLRYRHSGIDARLPDAHIDLRPQPGVSFRVSFTDGAGNAMGDGSLNLDGPNGHVYEESGADGTFTTTVPPGQYSLRLSGHTVGGPGGQLSVPDVDLTRDRTMTFRLPVHTSTVEVRGADGPVPDAIVIGGTGDGRSSTWTPVATEHPGSQASVFFGPLNTDLNGRVTVEALSGAPLSISVRPPAGAALGPAFAGAAADATVTTIRLPDGGLVSGQVHVPLDNGHDDIGVGVTGNPAVLPSTTDDQGRFSLQVAPGPARLSLGRGGDSSDVDWPPPTSWHASGDVMLVPGQPLDITLQQTTTEVRFADEDGMPLPVWAVADADVAQLPVGPGTFAGHAETRGAWGKATDRLWVRSFRGSTGAVHVQSHDWIRATGVPLAADGRVTLALAAPTSDPAGAIPIPSTSTTTTTTTTTTRPSGPPSGGGSTTTTTAPSETSKASLPTGSGGSGYWMVTAAGAVHAFGDAKHYGEPAGSLGGARAVRLEPTPTGRGYRVLDNRGVVRAYGDASHHGDVNRAGLAAGELPTSLSGTPTGKGYWIFTTRGRVLTFGDAAFYGDVSSLTLNGPVLGSVATPTGRGYYMVASDGGIFTFGDARFHGSTANLKLNKPVMGMAPAGDGSGYWLVASDGGIFAFSVPFHGSMGAVPLNKPISGIVPGRGGYLMVAEDGGIFSFGQVAFHGSLGATPPASPVVSAALLP